MTESTTLTALITGGASGIGLATAHVFVQQGWRVVLIGRDQLKLNQACEELGSAASAFSCDLSNPAEINTTIQLILEKYAPIHALVNNAGINQKKPFLEVSEQDFTGILQTNVVGTFLISQLLVRHFLETGSGTIVNVSSMASQYGIPKVIAYTASKSAIEGMTRAMASELSGNNIRVNCVAPGFIATEMSAKALNNDPERKEKVLTRTPMNRLGTAAEVGETIFFLASPKSSFITGEIVRVDGGNAIGF